MTNFVEKASKDFYLTLDGRQGENWKGQCTKITPGGLLKERRSPAYCTVKALANGFPNCYGGQIATFFPALLGSSLPRDT